MEQDLVAAVAAAALILYYLWGWLTAGPKSPDPWGPEVEEEIASPEAEPICLRCFAVSEQTDAFCPFCGAPVGPYRSTDPYRAIFCYDAPFETSHLEHKGLLLTGYSLLAPQFLGPFALPYGILIALRIGKGKPAEREDLPGDSTESGLS